ncbi:MAG TPA: hypothetical protein VK968_15050 [Roseimicrobium sp.]|nr:hypothetical protein [Roseimicrobium sp.]
MPTSISGPLPEERVQLVLRRLSELEQKNFARIDTARAWLDQRGITDLALADRLHLGWSDGGLPEILPNDPQLHGELTTLGVLTPKGRERFTNCLIVPIFGHDGQIANLVGLPATGPQKILPNRPLPPWNLAAAKTASALLLVPSILDALALMMAGQANVLALFPDGGVFDADVLKKWGVQRLSIVQGDTPDALAVTKTIQAKLGNYPPGIITLRGTGSASAMLAAHGAKALSEALVADAHGVSTLNIPGMLPLPGGLTLVIANRRYDVRGLQAGPSRMKVTVRSERGGRVHVDTLDLFVARSRRQLVMDLVRLHEESADTIEADVVKLLAACELRAAQPDLTTNQDASDPMPEADRREAEAMGKDPKLIDVILDDYAQCGLVGERTNTLLSYLGMTSRKMPSPLALMTLSSAGSGKSILQNTTHAFCPPEEAIKTTNLSAKALFHRDKNSLKHKFLVLEEGKGMESAAYALRVLISSGELITEVATKDPSSWRLVAMRNRVEGPVAVSLTTTSPDTDAETRSRFFVISTDESPEQTEAILDLQRRQQTLEGLQAVDARKTIYRRHHAFQRLLQPIHVINPLVQRMRGMSNRLTARRDQPKLLGLVNAVAFLRQMTKPVKQHGTLTYIEVDEVDLRIAADLLHVLTGPGSQEVSRPARELLGVLMRMRKQSGATSGEFGFTRRQVREFAQWERTRVHRYLAELLDLEYVLRDRSRRGTTDRYILAWDGEKSFGEADNILPFDNLRPSPSKAANA